MNSRPCHFDQAFMVSKIVSKNFFFKILLTKIKNNSTHNKRLSIRPIIVQKICNASGASFFSLNLKFHSKQKHTEPANWRVMAYLRRLHTLHLSRNSVCLTPSKNDRRNHGFWTVLDSCSFRRGLRKEEERSNTKG